MATDKNQQLPGMGQGDAVAGPVECLGMTFPNDEARRAHFTEKLREKLRDPEFRRLDGFPTGEDEAILRMSDPPYYTACPNPFVEDFVQAYGKPYDPQEPYRREPFAVDVSVGKTDQLYKAHSYHTKVPHLAIVPSILHYTEPGDVVLDGFCGSGMTGVAAQWCGTAPIGYRRSLEAQWKEDGHPAPNWGARRVILNDLGPAASFIAAGYNLPFDVAEFERTAKHLLRSVRDEVGWMYETLHTDGQTKGRINYTVWSEVFSCPECGGEVSFVKEALDAATKRVLSEFPCPSCTALLTKRNLERSYETVVDPASGAPYKRIRLRPAFLNYTVGKTKHEKPLGPDDLATLARIDALPLPPEVPTAEFPIAEMYHGSRLAPKGFTRVHHLLVRRAAHALAALWRMADAVGDDRTRLAMLYFVEQGVRNLSVLNAYEPLAYSQNARGQKIVYYVPSQHAEVSPWFFLDGKLSRLAKAFSPMPSVRSMGMVSTGDCADLRVTNSSIDYIFTDPPFGENIFYADLNFVTESWHGVFTATGTEAIVDRKKRKSIHDYQELMRRCFAEYHRVLKPGRWITVVFHNSKNAVWNAIQEAMLAGGFVVADVRTLDKQQGSYRQVTSSAVKQDLIISAYRPSDELEERLKITAGTEDSAWEFVRSHLRQVPLLIAKDGRVQVIAERQAYVLYDRMVAFHVQRGYSVPLAVAEFHGGLQQRFPERDGMYFLPDQTSEYDQKRLEVHEVEQFELFVNDEKSAIQWVRRQLAERPMLYQDLQPLYMQEAQRVWEKHEQPLELATILEQNFLSDDGGKWRVPDAKREGDLEQVRHKALLKEFEQYQEAKGRLKVVRTEALRAGFKECWQTQDYATIVLMAKRVPDAVVQEDPALLMYFDNALMRTEG